MLELMTCYVYDYATVGCRSLNILGWLWCHFKHYPDKWRSLGNLPCRSSRPFSQCTCTQCCIH